jgi:hypothetical protein
VTRVKSLNLLSHSYSFEHRSFLPQALFNNNVKSALLVLNNARFTCFVVYLTTLLLTPARLRQIVGLLIHNKSEWIIFMSVPPRIFIYQLIKHQQNAHVFIYT